MVSSLIPSINVGWSNEYVSDDRLSFPNGQYHGIYLKVENNYATTHAFIRSSLMYHCVYGKEFSSA